MDKKYEAFHNAYMTSTSILVCPQCQQGCLHFEQSTGKNVSFPFKCTKNSSSTAAYICTQRKPYTTTNYCEKYETASENGEREGRKGRNRTSLGNEIGLAVLNGISDAITKNQTKNDTNTNREATFSPKNWWVTFILCLTFGVFGFHRFYVGKIGSGIISLLTLGGLGIWTLIDIVMLIKEDFTDSEGNYIFR